MVSRTTTDFNTHLALSKTLSHNLITNLWSGYNTIYLEGLQGGLNEITSITIFFKIKALCNKKLCSTFALRELISLNYLSNILFQIVRFIIWENMGFTMRNPCEVGKHVRKRSARDTYFLFFPAYCKFRKKKN